MQIALKKTPIEARRTKPSCNKKKGGQRKKFADEIRKPIGILEIGIDGNSYIIKPTV